MCLLAFLAACQRQEGAYTYEAVNAKGWHYDSAAVIAIDTLPISDTYAPELHVRLTQHYPYDTLLLVVEQTWQAPSGSTTADSLRTDNPTLHRRDTLTLSVATASNELGGVGVSRLHFQTDLPTMQLRAGQSGTIRIKPAMLVHRLRGVSDVGIRLQPTSTQSR